MAVPRPDPLPRPNFAERRYVEPVRNWWTELATYLPGSWVDRVRLQENFAERNAKKVGKETLKNRFQQLNMFIDDNIGNDAWEPVRYLGEGSFGRVGLWQKRDASTNAVLHQVTVKQQEPMMRDLSLQGEGLNTSHLYDYKYNRLNDLYRFYQLYCEHGTLQGLLDRYSIFDEFLPEPAIWHIFLQLSQAIKSMQQDPRPHALPESLPTPNGDARVYALHLDFKPDNIFIDRMNDKGLGHPKHYPTIRLADFGLSAYTSLEDPRNPEAPMHQVGTNINDGLSWRGTKGYRSPEQNGWRSEAYVNPPNRPLTKLSEAQAVWELGKCLFDVVLHTDGSILGQWMDYDGQRNEEQYLTNGRHFMNRNWRQDFLQWYGTRETRESWPYSQSLMGLIWRCLAPSAARRINLVTLIKRIGEGLLEHGRSAQKWKEMAHRHGQDAVDARLRLFYARNEINDMPVGAANFRPLDAAFIQQLVNGSDPDWPPLRPPHGKYPILNAGPVGQRHAVKDAFGDVYQAWTLDDALQARYDANQRRTKQQWLQLSVNVLAEELRTNMELGEDDDTVAKLLYKYNFSKDAIANFVMRNLKGEELEVAGEHPKYGTKARRLNEPVRLDNEGEAANNDVDVRETTKMGPVSNGVDSGQHEESVLGHEAISRATATVRDQLMTLTIEELLSELKGRAPASLVAEWKMIVVNKRPSKKNIVDAIIRRRAGKKFDLKFSEDEEELQKKAEKTTIGSTSKDDRDGDNASKRGSQQKLTNDDIHRPADAGFSDGHDPNDKAIDNDGLSRASKRIRSRTGILGADEPHVAHDSHHRQAEPAVIDVATSSATGQVGPNPAAAQPPPALVPQQIQDSTYEEYGNHYDGDLRTELKDKRAGNLTINGRRMTKKQVIDALMQADQDGNRGNGWWKTAKLMKRPKRKR